MSSKKEWFICNNCGVYIYFDDIDKHFKLCNEQAGKTNFALQMCSCSERELLKDLVEKIPKQLQHSFVKQKCFYGLAKLKPVHCEGVQSKFNCSSSLNSKKITLSRAVMTLCGLSIGDRVVLSNSLGKQAVCRVLPQTKQGERSVGISTEISKMLQINPGDWLTVKPFLQVVPKADEMFLQPLVHPDDLYLKKNFLLYLRQYESGNAYSTDDLLVFRYMGKLYTFLVVTIKGMDDAAQTAEKCNFPLEKMPFRSNCPSEDDLIMQDDVELASKFLTDTNSVESDLMIESSQMDSKSNTSKSYACRSFHNNSPSFLHSTPIHSNISAKQTRTLTSDISVSKNSEQRTFYLISSTTTFRVLSGSQSSELENSKQLETFARIDGIEEKVNNLRQFIKNVFQNKHHPQYNGYHPYGALLHGLSGSGKTVIAKCIGNEKNCHFKSLSAALILKSYSDESQAALKRIFTEAIQRAPSIVFIDDVHILFPTSTNSGSTLEAKVGYDLASHLEILRQYCHPVFVLMATNQSNAVPVIRTKLKGLIEDVEISLLTCSQREQILQKMLSNLTNSVTKEDMKTIARSTPGFVASDVCSLCQIAEIEVCCGKNLDWNVAKPVEAISVRLQDITAALNRIKPNGLRELAVEVPEVHWSDIGGQEEIKHRLQYAVEIPLKHPEFFSFYGVNPPSGMLLYGPPGCSKTLIAKAVSTESKINFIAIKGHDLLSKWVGESERALKEVYRKARAASPCIVFFDEIDALSPARENETNQMMNRLLTQLLIEIDGTYSSKNVFTLAATNRPDRIDKALLRPGRLNHLLHVPLPDDVTRRKIFEIKFKKMSTSSNIDIDELVKKTENYSGAEIVGVCDEAAYQAFADESESTLHKIDWHHFQLALETITPRTSDFWIELYKAFSLVN